MVPHQNCRPDVLLKVKQSGFLFGFSKPNLRKRHSTRPEVSTRLGFFSQKWIVKPNESHLLSDDVA